MQVWRTCLHCRRPQAENRSKVSLVPRLIPSPFLGKFPSVRINYFPKERPFYKGSSRGERQVNTKFVSLNRAEAFFLKDQGLYHDLIVICGFDLPPTNKMFSSPVSSLESLPSTASPLSSCFPSPSSSNLDLPPVLSHVSKREYLLAQIRQKDAIIESLLKQVSTHYPTQALLQIKHPATQPLHSDAHVNCLLQNGHITVRCK